MESSGQGLVLSPHVICQELLNVLGRKEVEQPLICQSICICAQFWRYQHYLLPLWEWGVNKIVCFNLGSLRNVEQNGGPFPNTTYREAIRDKELVNKFNARDIDRRDALQAMLRHVAGIEMASMMKFCSSKRGIEHGLIKHYFKKLTLVQKMALGSAAEMDEQTVKKLAKWPPTAGYGGDKDLTDIPVYFCDDEYTLEDRKALERLSEIAKLAHLPPVAVVDAAAIVGHDLVDQHTLVYAIDPSFNNQDQVLERKPAAMIWVNQGCELEDYDEFPLDKNHAPHTVGSAHLYIRKDIVAAAEREKIVPPYPVTFPHDYPLEPERWYLGELKGNEGGIRRAVGEKSRDPPQHHAVKDTMTTDPLSPPAVLETAAKALPTHEKDDSTSDLSSSLDAIALFVHACMLNLGFRLLGFDEEQKIEAECARLAPRLPPQWNKSLNSHSFVYAHTQSAMNFVVHVDRMGAKIEIRALATGADRIARFDITARDYISQSALPLRITMTADGEEDRSDLPAKLKTLFISEERIKGIRPTLPPTTPTRARRPLHPPPP
ncbi:hypothetical protein VTJ49DRAFT_3221 [Mycothermus thermophilus]|uniref:PI31 proteasome regulator N-terminal domain-containing protein n=1 Tax=Humicola insolens TaxID=85995 RepID=A0ABR3VNH0_HUMIN